MIERVIIHVLYMYKNKQHEVSLTNTLAQEKGKTRKGGKERMQYDSDA
jgi:hypothetical protein